MESKEKLNSIIDKANEIGDKAYIDYKQTNRNKSARLAIRSYNTVLRAIIVKDM
jgi:hypothetical protein